MFSSEGHLSKIKMFIFFLLLVPSLGDAGNISPESKVVTFNDWISLLLSRGVYGILAISIALCFIYTMFKAKLSGDKETDENYSCEETRINEVWNSNSLPPEVDSSSSPQDSNESELNTTNVTSTEEENTTDVEKASSEVNLMALLNEETSKMKKELVGSESQLKMALKEKEDISWELEKLKKERIESLPEIILKEQQDLVECLENARSEVEALKVQIKSMKAERDMAVTLASEMMEKAKGVALRDSERTMLIEDIIDSELRRVRDEDSGGDMGEPEISSKLGQGEGPDIECTRNECGSKCILHSDIRALSLAVGDGPLTICNNLNDLFIAIQPPENQEEPHEPISTSSGSSATSFDEEGDSDKQNLLTVLTGSPWYRDFLAQRGLPY